MKKRFGFLVATALLLCAVSQAQFARKGVRFGDQVTLASMPGAPTAGAGCTGWVSPNGREYGIMGVRNGTQIFDVTNPAVVETLTRIPGPTSTWHENATLNGYGYFVTDSTGAIGVQIVDLRSLDTTRIATLKATYTGNGLSNVHTIQGNPVTNRIYLNGSNRGFVILDATNPEAPVEIGRWQTKYVHDSLTVNYTTGPYAGKEIVFACCGGAGVYILDVTNPASIVVLGNMPYIASGGYCHSGVLSADKKYFLVNDEFDEDNQLVTTCSTHIINVEDLSNPIYLGAYTNGGNYIDHNSRWKDNYVLLAAYRGGLRIYDASNPVAMNETGFFDTDSGTGMTYAGAWGTYVFPSGNAIIAEMQRGLFAVDPTEAMGLGAVPMSFAVNRGNLLGGGLLQIRRTDDNYMVLEGFAAGASRSTTGVGATIAYETTNMPSAWVQVSFEGKVTNVTAANLVVYMKDWGTGQWAQVGTLAVGNSESPASTGNVPASTFVNASGQVEVKFEAFASTRTTSPTFQLSIDQLKVNVHN